MNKIVVESIEPDHLNIKKIYVSNIIETNHGYKCIIKKIFINSHLVNNFYEFEIEFIHPIALKGRMGTFFYSKKLTNIEYGFGIKNCYYSLNQKINLL